MARVRRPESSPMIVNDRAADGQPHAQSVRLRRVERVEQAGRLVLPEADAGILDRDDCPRAVVTVFHGRAHDQSAPLGWDLSHGFGRVRYEVEEDLLELDPIAHDRRHVRRQGHLQSYPVSPQLGPDEGVHPADDPGQVARLVGDR